MLKTQNRHPLASKPSLEKGVLKHVCSVEIAFKTAKYALFQKSFETARLFATNKKHNS